MKKILLLSSLFIAMTAQANEDVRPSFEPRDLEIVLKGGESKYIRYIRYFFSGYFKTIKPTPWVQGKADLRYADLSGKTIKNMRLIGALFNHANLKDTTFYNCTLDNADFSSADLSMATLEKCSVNNATFTGTTVEQLHVEKSSFLGTSFENLQEASTISINKCNFAGSKWFGTLLRGARISKSNFDTTSFDSKCHFFGGIITESTFTSSTVYRRQFKNTLIDEKSKNTHAAFYDESRLFPFALLTLKRKNK